VAAARAIGYTNAGTVEFIVDEAILDRRRAGEDVDPSEAFAFLEVNTRLQVEHPVTEAVVRARDPQTGALDPIDLVRLQLLVAGGAPLPFGQDELSTSGHAIEARLYAEDVRHDYLPAVGRLHAFEPAELDGVRWDSGVRAGDDITPHYDPMLAKVIAWGPSRTEAASRLATALRRTLLHATTNRDLLVAVLRDEAFLAGATTTDLLDDRFPDARDRVSEPSRSAIELALVAAALHGALQRRSTATVLATLPAGFSNTRAFPQQVRYLSPGEDAPRTVRYRGTDRAEGGWRVQLLGEVPPGEFDGPSEAVPETAVVVHHAAEDHLDLEVAGHRQRAQVRRSGPESDGGSVWVETVEGWIQLFELPRFPSEQAGEVAGATLAPMPGSVVTVAVAEGTTVARGDLLVTVEAMKMEHRVTAASDGVVITVRVAAGDQVDAGDVLVVVGPPDTDPQAADDVE
jgi:propionyl-CoA carboxylase alpha chain